MIVVVAFIFFLMLIAAMYGIYWLEERDYRQSQEDEDDV